VTEPLFRQEALDHHARPPGPGGPLRIQLPWIQWLYRGLFLAVIVGGAAAYGMRVDERAVGPALVEAGGRTFAALLPAATTGVVEPGAPVRLQLGGARLTGRAHTVDAVDGARARQAGFGAAAGSHVLVRGVLDGPVTVATTPAAPAVAGRADVLVGSPRLLSVLLG